MRLIVAGGRDFKNFEYGFKCIDHMTRDTPKEDITIICGKALGGDTCGEKWYELHKHGGVKIEYFIPDWDDISKPDAVIKVNKFGKEYNAKAGMDRNHEMGDTGTHLIAFWNNVSKGTKDMINYMTKLGKHVKVFNY